jgi:hypothetical protein
MQESWVKDLLLTTASIGLAGMVGALGWTITNLIFAPIQATRAILRAAYEDRWYYSSSYWNATTLDPQDWQTASDTLRRHAAKIDGIRYERILWRGLWRRLKLLPSDKALENASRGFTLLSNAPAMLRAPHTVAMKAILNAEGNIDEALTGKRREPAKET